MEAPILSLQSAAHALGHVILIKASRACRDETRSGAPDPGHGERVQRAAALTSFPAVSPHRFLPVKGGDRFSDFPKFPRMAVPVETR